MGIQQKAFIVRVTREKVSGLRKLNKHLAAGWRVIKVKSLDGVALGNSSADSAVQFAAFVIAERMDDEETAMAVAAAEEVEEIVDDVVEGDGASHDLDDPPEING